MTEPCRFLNPLQRDGTSQRQRMAPALDPAHVLPDERDSGDLLAYLLRYAPLLRYYNDSNSPAGDWTEFLARDPAAVVAGIRAEDLAQRRAAFEAARGSALAATAAAWPAAAKALFVPAFEIAALLERWQRGAVPGLSLAGMLSRLIQSAGADLLRDALRCARRAQALGLPVTLPDIETFGTVWGALGEGADGSWLPSGTADPGAEREAAVERIARIFERLTEIAALVAGNANQFLQEVLERHPAHAPHAALLLAFLSLYRRAQTQLNTLTKRHLDFYYREVLRLVPLPEVPDRVHLVFEPAKGVERFRLAKDTALNAGKDATGVALAYALDDELVVNRARLHPEGLKTVFVQKKATGEVVNIYAAPRADSADGLGAEIEGEEKKWEGFGAATMPHAEIGFAIASPMFFLADGARSLTLTFRLQRGSNFLAGKTARAVERELRHNVRVLATGEKGWIELEANEVTVTPTSAPEVVYSIGVPEEAGPIVACDAKVHGGALGTRWPVLKFALDNRGLSADALPDLAKARDIQDYSDEVKGYPHESLVRHGGRVFQARVPIEKAGFRPANHPELWGAVEPSYPYKYFLGMALEELEIEVEVKEMKRLILETELGLAAPGKPFAPFGPIPRKESALLIGSHEAFQKRLTEFTFTVTWSGLPEENFKAHYSEYKTSTSGAGATSPVTRNDYFKADLDVLQPGGWTTLAADHRLFDPADDSAQPKEQTEFTGNPSTTGERPALRSFDRFDPSLKRGFARLVLKQGFLHDLYPAALAFAAKDANRAVPKPPHTPLIAGVSLDYKATETLEFWKLRGRDFEDRVERIFQLGPFGHREIFPIPDDPAAAGVPIDRCLVPRFNVTVTAPDGTLREETAEGTLYLGIDGLDPPQNLSILIQAAEGSEDPSLPTPPTRWSYLAAEGWVDFSTAEVVADGTRGLVRSGILQLAMPRAMTRDSTLIRPGLHWIKVSLPTNAAALPRLIALHAQAAQASFRNQGNDPAHLARPLAAGAIAKLKNREAAIKGVSQPYASFGGRMRESDEAFYVRAAERLRHKRRAVTVFDYERLVLEQFPEVYKVRCINHTRDLSEYQPGSVRLIVVPNLRNRNAIDPLRPRLALSRLKAIEEYLREIAPEFASIEVANPEYEEVRARFNVRFHPGRDQGFYTAQIEQDIVRFLSPWLYDEAVDLAFGGRVHRSAILNFIDERDYVDFVTDFEMDHIVAGRTFSNVEEARATTSSAVLVPAKTHGIGHDIVSCEDRREVPAAPAAPAPAPSPEPPTGAKRYLGNAASRELHDLARVTPMCRISEIGRDRRYYWARIEDALALGYDFCAHCFGRERSKR
jgi:hypothetical protein